ncbi:hypothetical protein BG004_006740, partial [Podila humilis]
ANGFFTLTTITSNVLNGQRSTQPYGPTCISCSICLNFYSVLDVWISFESINSPRNTNTRNLLRFLLQTSSAT